MESSPPTAVEKEITIGMLLFFSVVGMAGNGLVIYAFRNSTSKMTATIFILTLAGIDFIACIITIPTTVAMEILQFQLQSDVLCKLYHFLMTSLIPLSASVMVAIAVDRYFCICRPFMKIMTVFRAKIIVICLCSISLVIGFVSCLHYGTKMADGDVHFVLLNDSSETNVTDEEADHIEVFYHDYFIKYLSANENTYITDVQALCFRTNEVFGSDENDIYVKIYSSFFAICGMVVIIFYIMIYRFVIFRRKRLLKSNSLPSFTSKQATQGTVVEKTEKENDGHDKQLNHCDGENEEDHNSRLKPLLKNHRESETKASIMRQKEDRIRSSNLKTAIMVSLVAFVFIMAFLPSWMMKLKLIPFNIIVFYLYFIYNVANPFIYAFMNPEFQEKMKALNRKFRWK